MGEFVRTTLTVDGLAADVIGPRRPLARSPLVVCWPGGGIGRGYWDLQPEGASDYSFAEHMACHGFTTALVDHLGTGDSARPGGRESLTSELVADAGARAATALLDQFRSATLAPGLAPAEDAVAIAVGHSMGSLFSVWQQARHQPYAGLVLLGFGADGVQLDVALGFTEQARAHRASFLNDETIDAGGTAASDLLLAGMPVPAPAYRSLLATATTMVPTDGIDRLRRGAPELDAIDVPIFIGNGDRDITGDTQAVASAFANVKDATAFVLADTGHNHNVAPNRQLLWDAIAAWIEQRFPW